MLKSINNPSLIDILPPVILKDEKLKAAAKALDVELKKLSADAQLVLHLPRLDELPNEVLDQLANQYHVDFYEPAEMDLETKRKLIRESLLWHRIKGTKAAVEKLLNTITRGAKVSEWYEYNGKPYFFKVNLQGLLDYGDNGETFLRMINSTKNERSWLDAVDFDLSKEHPDTTLYLAQLELQQGNNFYDLNNRQSARQSLKVLQGGNQNGRILFDITTNNNTKHNLTPRAGFITLTHGRISFNCENELPDEETIEDFERYIRWRWAQFKTNPVVKWYTHGTHGEDDGEIDNPDEPEYFPVDTDFLRIYWAYDCPNDQDGAGGKNYHLRYQTILQPRQDVTGKEINYLSAVGTSSQMLLHSKLKVPTSGIIRAIYVKKEELKII